MPFGWRQIEIVEPQQADRGDVVTALAQTCPQMVGKVIRQDRSGPVESYTFNLNGTAFVGDGHLV